MTADAPTELTLFIAPDRFTLARTQSIDLLLPDNIQSPEALQTIRLRECHIHGEDEPPVATGRWATFSIDERSPRIFQLAWPAICRNDHPGVRAAKERD